MLLAIACMLVTTTLLCSVQLHVQLQMHIIGSAPSESMKLLDWSAQGLRPPAFMSQS